jgi:alanine racemase
MTGLESHAARLTVDLAALQENWRFLNALNAPGMAGAVIKADAYGLGIEMVAPALYAAGCRSFFVAHGSEGTRARSVLPEGEIFVLNGLAGAECTRYRRDRLSPVLGTRAELETWLSWTAEDDGFAKAALHVDTGMNRLGVRPETLRDLCQSGMLPHPAISIVMSHFVSSEQIHDPVTTGQIVRFSDLAKAIEAAEKAIHALGKSIPKTRLSICNSSGHFTAAAGKFDLSRPGYALYGGNPRPGKPNPMRHVVRLEAPIIEILDVPEGETVGYSSNFIAMRPSRIATLSCGYADGYPRNGGSKPGKPGGAALIAGRECPFAGNVSMDLITVDITDLPEGSVAEGDFATLIGDGLDLDRVGQSAGTIGYEILTNLGRRYNRLAVERNR